MEFWSLFTPYSCLPAGSIYLLVITSPERKARVEKLLLPSACTLSHYPSCSWRLGKLSLQWLVSMCGFQYSTAPKYLYLPYSPLKGWSYRPILLLERYVKYTSGSSRICTLSRVERFWVEEWQDKNCIWRGLREGLQKRRKWKTKRSVTGQLAFHAASFPCGHYTANMSTIFSILLENNYSLKLILFQFFNSNESHQFIWKIFWKTVLYFWR